MDFERVDVAERLAGEFPLVPPPTVMRVVTRCVEELPEADPLIIEQAARAELGKLDTRSADGG